jgi:hypothetical protein
MQNNFPNSHSSETSQNSKVRYFEKKSEETAKEIFKQLCQLNDYQNTIDLNFLRQALVINDNKYSDAFLKIITKYQLTDAIKEGNFNKDSFYKKILSAEEFTHFISGKGVKELLFETENLNEKRFKTEEYYKLYELMGGTSEGINKEKIKKNLEIFYTCLNGSFDKEVVEAETNEIIELLASDNEKLSIQDFVNAMTSEVQFPRKDGSDLFN